MAKQREIYQLISAIVLALILILASGLFFWKAGFFNETKKSECSIEFINLCTTEEVCMNNSFYWWDSSCHINDLKCSKTYFHLCTTKEVCEGNDFYWWNDVCQLVEKPESEPSVYPDFDYYEELEKRLFVKKQSSWVDKDGKVVGRQFSRFKVKGDISVAYLFVDISIDSNKPLTNWDSIYITLRPINWPVRGGHLFRSYSLGVPDGETTKLLFDLRQVPYTYLPYSENRTPALTSWFNILEDDYNLELETFLSTLQKTGKINEISIGFKCSEETPDCDLIIEK